MFPLVFSLFGTDLLHFVQSVNENFHITSDAKVSILFLLIFQVQPMNLQLLVGDGY
jgi:hypothetical protein